jgi:DNA-binding response OmpR family regulator
VSNIGKRLLLVDDDAQLVELLALKLSKLGYHVEYASVPEDGYKLALDHEFDVIVLDIVMPRLTGLEICANLRGRGVLTPVLVLSGQSDKTIVVQGLNTGADDYLTKPFDDDELVARIKALLRRNRRAFHTQTLERAGIELDVPARMARCDGKVITLTQKETLLLKRLMAESPSPIPRLSLLQDVWGIGSSHASNRLDVYIRRVRQKLKKLCGDDYIYTLRSGGYYFDQPRKIRTN